MKEHPILFSGPMVRALLADKKHVTRRLSKQWLKVKAGDRLWVRETHSILDMRPDVTLTEGPTRPTLAFPASVAYIADDEESGFTVGPSDWRESFDADHVIVRPSIHMPRWASRILLECEEDARLERLQDITEEEAEAEGCSGSDDGLECNFCGEWRGYEDSCGVLRVDDSNGEDWHFVCPKCGETLAHWPVDEECRQQFRDLWSALHTKPGERWNDNPEVARVGRFHRVIA